MNLRNYASDRWIDGHGPQTQLRDATTGEPVATMHHRGPDPHALLAHARDVGGPALRRLTFGERAAILRGLAKHLTGRLDDLAALSTHTGATRRDTELDVDAGIAAVAFYADRAARELPNATILVDGEPDPLGRHVRTPKLGAAVQLNAYNLPVWSLLRRFAPAFLAGMPTVVTPDQRTAYLTERAVHHIIDSGLLPEGTLSLLCARPTGLLDALTAQDTLSFSGSAGAARLIRTHAAIANRSVPCTVETDTANAAILGPDVDIADPELGRYVNHVVTDLTRKAGQRSTAIRRAFVPDALADDVTEAIRARLATVAIGHPALPDTEMGPLIGLHQRDDVRVAITQLTRTVKIAFGDPHTVDVAGADPDRGAFISPVLLRAEDVRTPEPHEVVAFGPVCTVLPYDTLDDVVTAVALGGGSLTGTIVTNDVDTAHHLLTELAPWHGRLRILDRTHDPVEVAPQLMHGGPGRAGGGAELGGLHALTQYQQKTAIEGHRSFPWRPYS